jgi:hypothetical protein
MYGAVASDEHWTFPFFAAFLHGLAHAYDSAFGVANRSTYGLAEHHHALWYARVAEAECCGASLADDDIACAKEWTECLEIISATFRRSKKGFYRLLEVLLQSI